MFKKIETVGLFALLLLGLSLALPIPLFANSSDSIILEHSEEWYIISTTYVQDVSAADIDQDGAVEIVTVGWFENCSTWDGGKVRVGQIRIWNWNGTALELEHNEYLCPKSNVITRTLVGVAIDDVDDDGAKEIVTFGQTWEPSPDTCYRCELAIWNWNGTVLEREHVESWYTIRDMDASDVYVGDVDNEGTKEIITTGAYWNMSGSGKTGGQLRIWNWNGTVLALEHSEEWEAPDADKVLPNSVFAEDVDQDDVVEIISGGFKGTGSNYTSQVWIWNWNETTSTLTLEHNEEWGEFTSTNSSVVNSVFAKDLNNDDVTEIITSGYAYTPVHAQLRIWNWNGTLFTLEHNEEWNYTNGAVAYRICADDVNSDGITELISVGHMNNDTYWQGQLRTWQWNGTNLALMHDEQWGDADTRGYSVFVSDVDGDYLKEILTGGLYNDGARWNGQLRIWSFEDLTPPVADAGPNQEVNEDTIVTFNGSGSWDYANIVSYVWTFTDVTPQTLTGVTPNYNFTNPGIYIVTLNVTDVGENWDTDNVTITVLDITPPTIGIPSQNPGPTAVGPYQNVNVTVEVTDEGTGVREVNISYSIDEGETWINTTMNNTEGNTYLGEIPGFLADTHVQYKIIAHDNADNPAVEDNAGEYYVYTVIPEFQGLIILIIIVTTSIAMILAKKKKQLQPSFSQIRKTQV